MLDVLADNPVLTLFLVVGLGSALGLVVGGGTEPAVGYALTYPLGVVLGIIAVHLEMGRPRATPKDPGSAAVAGLTDLTIVVGRRARLADVPGAAEEAVRFSFGRHGRSVEVAGAGAVVEPGWWPGSCSAGRSGPGRSSGASPPGPA